jgi:hypothetical protein
MGRDQCLHDLKLALLSRNDQRGGVEFSLPIRVGAPCDQRIHCRQVVRSRRRQQMLAAGIFGTPTSSGQQERGNRQCESPQRSEWSFVMRLIPCRRAVSRRRAHISASRKDRL